MDVKVIAAMLLVIRLLATLFIGAVLVQQYQLMKAQVSDDIGALRKVLMALAVIILLSHVIPIMVDIITLFGNPLNRTVTPIGVMYAFSNDFSGLIASLLLWTVYRVTQAQNIRLRKSVNSAEGEESKL